jgi:hypothetical protein
MSDSTSTPPQILEPDFTKTDALATYGIRFGRFIYGWNHFLLSRWESSTQVGVQNLSGCCVTVCWAVGPCTVLEPVRVASRGLASP